MKKRLLFLKTCLVLLLPALAGGQAHATVTVNSTNFPDDNFRAAVAQAAGVSENGGTFAEGSLTSLDVSNKGISNLMGLEQLTGLNSLNISDNNGLTTGADITALTALTRLEARNCNLRTLADTQETYSGSTYAGLTMDSGNSGLRYLDLSGNQRFYYSGNLQYLTGLETLLLKDCTYFDHWGYLPGNGMTSLKWVDVSGCTAMDRIHLWGASQLKHLNAEGTLIQGFTTSPSSSATTANYIVLSANCPVEYINIGNCKVTNAGLNGITTYNVTHLDTLIMNGNSTFGHSTAFAQMPALSYLDISGCDIYFREGTSNNYFLLHYLTPSNNPNLETLLVNNSNLGTNTQGITGFAMLKTVNASGNPGMVHFGVNGSPLLQSLDLSGNSGLTDLSLNDDALPRSDFNLIGASGLTAVQSLYLNGNNYSTIGQATSDFSDLGSLAFLYLENNSGFAGGPLTLNAGDCGTLTGIDLGNNGFTSFHAPSLPPTLTALMLGNNPSMTRLEMHNNPGIITMTSSPTMSNGSGLYLLGNTALTYMDISGTADVPNHFQRIGNNNSLQGVPIVTLKASHNNFYTFRNLTTVSTRDGWETYHKSNLTYGWKNYDSSLSDGGIPNSNIYYYGFWPASPAQPDSASLEQLTRLEYLDLSYCHLKDSVFLHKNTQLRYLDVSHNRTIKRYYERRTPDKGDAYRAYVDPNGYIDKRNFPDYKIYIWLKDPNSTGLEEFTGDYNDTIGLYNLDLVYNDQLEYLDISYTGIEQTAANHCYVPNARYIWIQDLNKLKYFYADYNGMRSLGLTTRNGRNHREGLKSLERVSAIGMRGADDKTMKGSINYQSIDPNVNANPSPLVNLHYINFSYSSYDSIGILNEKVDTLIVRGNPIHNLNLQALPAITYVDARECAFKMRGYDPETGRTYPPNVDRFKNGARDGGFYTDTCTNKFPNPTATRYRLNSDFSGLRKVTAYGRPELTTLLLDSCNALTDVYAHHNPKLPKIHGFEHLAYPKPQVDAQYHYPPDVDSLRLVWVNDNPVFNELNLTQNVNLKYLHAYNDKMLGNSLPNGMHLNENGSLKSIWVSNSALRSFSNNAGNNLDTLKLWQNPHLSALDVTDNKRLKVFDLHNCMIRNLDMSECAELTYFDCCNNDSIIDGTQTPLWDAYEVYGYEVPGCVPQSVNTPGLNSIAELQFAGDSLKTVIADCNDLFAIRGLAGNTKLIRLSYSYNHVNAIDLTGCSALDDTAYNYTHNGRGFFEAEYSKWYEKNGNNVDTCHVYYLQLDPNAGDELKEGYDSFLGYKAGYDSISGVDADERWRTFDQDGFDPNMVAAFTLSSSGPHQGLRHAAPQRNQVVYDTQHEPDTTKMYGKVVFLDVTDNTDWPDHHYIEYEYYDGRVNTRGTRSKSTFYMVWTAPGVPTDVEETAADNLGEPTVVRERYFDISGKEYSEPVKGVNIILREMSDGSTQSIKVMR